MAKIRAGALSHPSGKFGSLVGATWKGIKYIREYVIPANPRTDAQIAQRLWFTVVVRVAKALLGSVLQPFWDPFLKSNSGYATFIGRALKDMTGVADIPSIKIADGSLEGAVIATAVYAGSDVTVTWDAAVLGNGDAADMAGAFVYDAVHGVGFFNGSAARSVETVNVTVGSARVAGDLKCWLFFADDATNPTRVATSNYQQVAV